MKKSVGQTNPWAEKLDQLPINVAVETSWAQMEQLLEQHMPIAQPTSTPSPNLKPKQILSPFKYILSIVATISLLTYFLTKTPSEVKEKKQQPKEQILKKEHTDTVDTDSSHLPIIVIKEQHSITMPKQTIALRETNMQQTMVPIVDTVQQQSAISATQLQLNPYQASVKVGDVDLPTFIHLKLPVQKEIQLGRENSPLPIRELNGIRNKSKRNQRLASLKIKRAKSQKTKAVKEISPVITPQYSFEVQLGLNNYSNNTTNYTAIAGTYALNQHLLVSAGFRLNINRTIAGSYTTPSYNQIQPGPPLSVIDNRKFNALEIPLSLSYKINNTISLKAGPFISFALKQRGGAKLGPVVNHLDTIFHSKEIKSTLAGTTINSANIGFASAINLQYKQFGFELGFAQQINPYRIQNNFGSYKQYYRIFTIGLSYQLRSKRQVAKK